VRKALKKSPKRRARTVGLRIIISRLSWQALGLDNILPQEIGDFSPELQIILEDILVRD
jgi:hypothetical protein